MSSTAGKLNTKVFPADLTSLHPMLDFIRAFLKVIEMDADLKDKIVLASEEALVNIIKHGYPQWGEGGRVEIGCEKLSVQSGVKIVIRDQGVPFNPIEHIDLPPPTLIRDPDDLALGGLGIAIFVSLMDRVEYQQIPGGNQLTLIKYNDPDPLSWMSEPE